MEAALFTLDIVLIVLLIRAVQLADREPKAGRGLGVFSFLESKTDEVQKGLGVKKGRRNA